ncbi:hypothetical protein NSTC745_04135 [Nostoc sp. DSM 114161]
MLLKQLVTKYNISLVHGEISACLCALLYLNFNPQFAMILRKVVLSTCTLNNCKCGLMHILDIL